MENSGSKKNSILAVMGLTKSNIEYEYELDTTKFIFNDRIEIGKKPYLCNKQHTLAILLIEEIQDLIDTWGLDDTRTLSEQEYYGDIDMFGQYPIWDELKEYNKLDSPKYFIYRKAYPMVVVYEKVAYIVAPALDKKEPDDTDSETGESNAKK